jgi:phosphoribosyl 1,2-cyclic phosphate phosphodiesterase
MNVRFLGTGTSHGVPVVACTCRVCRSTDFRDKRNRSSLYIHGAHDERILIDAGPEFRLQAIAAALDRLDTILITHAHADHVHGLDDVRPLTRHGPLDVWASAADVEELQQRFSYAFAQGQEGGGKPRLQLRQMPDSGISVGTLRINAIPMLHGSRPVNGYRIGRLAYLTDCSAIPAASMPLLSGLQVMIVDALRQRPHPTHFSIEQAFELARELQPEQLYLTHFCHDLSHVELEDLCAAAKLPGKAAPAWDGLRIRLADQASQSDDIDPPTGPR